MTQINWDVTRKDAILIGEITKRGAKLAFDMGIGYPASDMSMDITAVHLNDCKLKLKELADSDETNFAHDIFGIRSHIDRKTGKLLDCFLPRFSA